MWKNEERRMIQLKPHLKAPLYQRSPYSFLQTKGFLLSLGAPTSMVTSNRFPFRDALPLYLKSQAGLSKSAKHNFPLHNTNKCLNRYYRSGATRSAGWKRKNMEALMLKGLRDLITSYEGQDELVSLQEYWAYKVSDYLIELIISQKSLQFPRLREFLKKRDYGDPKRFSYYKKMIGNWKNSNVKDPDVISWLKREYKPALDFIKRSIQDINIFIEMNMGTRKYRNRRLSNLRKTSALMNFVYDLLGTELSPELRLKMEKDQKVYHSKKKSYKKVVSFVVKDYARFNENRALTGICKKHFKTIYCAPKTQSKQPIFVPNIPVFHKLKSSELMSESHKNIGEIRRTKIYKPEIVPYAKIEYEKRIKSLSSKKLVFGHLKFLEDLQNIFGTSAKEIASRKPLEDILWGVKNTSDENEVPRAMETGSISSDGGKANIAPGNTLEGDDMKEIIIRPAGIKKEVNTGNEEWRKETVKKACYIIVRILRNMAMTKLLTTSDVMSEVETPSETSAASEPDSVKAQLTPFIALKSLLSEDMSGKLILPTLRHLKNNAKGLYKKIEEKERALVLDKFKEYNKIYARSSGMASEDRDIPKMLSEWDKEISNGGLNEGFTSTDSEKSIAYDVERPIFSYRGLRISNKRTGHIEVVCLLLLFLSVSDKILTVRNAANEFAGLKKTAKSELRGEFKARKKRKDIRLSEFKEFLKKNNAASDVEAYISVAERYCPDYLFYEHKSEVKRKQADRVASEEEVPETVAPSPVEGAEEEGEGGSLTTSRQEEEGRTFTPPLSDTQERQHAPPKSIQLSEGKSYLSFRKEGREGGRKEAGICLVKHTKDWSEPGEAGQEPGVPAAYRATDFFEFPTSLAALPKLVSGYTRPVVPPRIRQTYILDPYASSLKWEMAMWTKDECKLATFERLDRDLPWMRRYFTTFWLSEGEQDLPWEELQKLIFASWCGGDFHVLYDMSWKYFDAFSLAVEDFERLHGKSRRIYDVKEVRPTMRRNWIKVKDYLENQTTIGAMGLKEWQKRLTGLYQDVENCGSEVSYTSEMSSQASINRIRASLSVMDMSANRSGEKSEIPTGFPLRDSKSLQEALDNFLEKTKHFQVQRVCLFGTNYKPLTEQYLTRITQECGLVYTHGDPSLHPNARKAPPRAIFYNDKEKLFYRHSNKFIDTFQKKYPGRFLKMPFHVKNEYGSMKHVCTFICPRRLSWPKMDSWKGCMRCVCNKLECLPLEDPYRPPERMKSPYSTLAERKGNVFELSTLLTGFLVGAGYDAYCVCGTATYHRSYYANTDDVSPDPTDLEPPPTNRYKQYNLLAPFTSDWLRNTGAMKEPIPYEELEICRVKRNEKAAGLAVRKSWPTTEKGLIAFYSREVKKKVEERSRFDNPSIPLYNRVEEEEEATRVVKGGSKAVFLGHLYDQLIQELRKRTTQEKLGSLSDIAIKKTYTHEDVAPIKSTYESMRMRKQKEDREERRKLLKSKNEEISEEDEYFDWLYGPKGTHKDYYEMLQKEAERAGREKPESSIQLLEFLETYDPTIDRLETPTGEERHDILLRKFRCKKRLKKKTKAIQAIDWYKLSKLRVKKYQEKMIKMNKVFKEKDIYGFEELNTDLEALSTAEKKELNMKAHKYKMRQSPFIEKMLVKIEETFPNKVIFDRIIERLGFHVGDLELPTKEVRTDLEGEEMEVYGKLREERLRRRRIQKSRAKRAEESYVPSRIHCWVLVRAGARDVNESFFIDVLTGCRYPTSDRNYLKISCVWNHSNYYIPRYVPTLHEPTREFSLTDLGLWFHLLPLELASVERKKKPWWWDATGHPPQLQHTRVPPYWGRRVRIPHTEWDKKFAKSNKKTFNYKKTTIEAYDPAGRPTDGLLKRITTFFDMRKSILQEVSTKYSLRKDRLIWRSVDVNSGFVEEKFEEGRPDNLKIFRYLAFLLPGVYTPKEFQFYGKWRKDRLKSLLITKKYLLAEFREGRGDHLKRLKLNYTLRKSGRRFRVLDEHSSCVKRVRARYRELSPNYSVWKDTLGEVPRKVDINMAGGYSEYWYWDGELRTQVKWRSGHAASEDMRVLLSSPDLQDNPLLLREPLLYGVTVSLEDSPRELALRKERYAKREEKDRLDLMSVAKHLEQIVSDTVLLREYEKIKDVLRTTDEMKKNNLTTEKALVSMKKYFEMEREILVKDYNRMRRRGNIWDLWTCDEDQLTGKLLNYFVKEQFWLYFVIGGWDDMNKMFKTIVKERQDSIPVFSGYTDLLRTLLDAFNLGFRLTESRVPTAPKRDLDMWPLQINVPIGVGVQKLRQLSADLEDITAKDGGRPCKNNHRGTRLAEEGRGKSLETVSSESLTSKGETMASDKETESEEQVDLGSNIEGIQYECAVNCYPVTLEYSNLSRLKDGSDQETESSEAFTKWKSAQCIDVSNDLAERGTDFAKRNKVLSERNRSRQKSNLSKINNKESATHRKCAKNIDAVVSSTHVEPSFAKLGSYRAVDGKGTKSSKRVIPKRNLYIQKYKPLNGISYVEGNATETCGEIKSEKVVITKSNINVLKYNEFNDNRINNEYSSSNVLSVTNINKDSEATLVKDGRKRESEAFREKSAASKGTNCISSQHHSVTDDNENPSLKKMFLQITKILTPNQMKQFFKSGKQSIKHTWTEQFVNFYNTFIDDITTARTSNFSNDNEDIITELIDYNHPFGYQIDKLEKEFSAFKNRPLDERLSVEELGTILDTFRTKRKKKPIKEETRRKVTDIVNRIKKRYTLKSYSQTRATQNLIDNIIGSETSNPRTTVATKKKIKSQTVKFTFENSPETGGSLDIDTMDCYKLFLQKYHTDLKNIDNLQQFAEELENKPRSSLVVNKISNLDNVEHMNVSFKLQKGEYFADSGSEKAFQVSQDSNQLDMNEESGYPFMRKIITKLDSPTLEVKNYIDLGVVEVINLFSKPSELEFIEIGDPKFVKLQPILKEKDIKLYDSETSVCLRRMFPIDYSALELYNEVVPNDGILNFEGGKEKYVEDSSNVRSLRKSIDSCPHCVNVYYQANKDRLFILRMVELLRDENMAKTRARIDGAVQAENLLKSYQRAIQVFGDYVQLLKDSSSVTSSCGNKKACDECRQFRFFLEVLNYRTLLDYPRPPKEQTPWRRESHLEVPIPFYHSKRPSVGRVSLTSLEEPPPHLVPSLISLERGVDEAEVEETPELYPDVDEADPVRAELYRDLRPKTRKISKPKESTRSFGRQTARTEVIRKVVKKF